MTDDSAGRDTRMTASPLNNALSRCIEYMLLFGFERDWMERSIGRS
jgi:hypothetical protein